MSRLPRPYIPLAVRVKVAERQLVERGIWNENHVAAMAGSVQPAGMRLRHALSLLFGDKQVQLDHDPALATRPRFHNGLGPVLYLPDANDPEYLTYREKHEHHIKTQVRGDGAQHPDRVLIKKERRRGRKKRPKAKIRSRGFRKVEKERREQLPLPPRR